MKIERVAKILKRHEGLRLKPYRCPGGMWTIGYGRNLVDNGLRNFEWLHLVENRSGPWKCEAEPDNFVITASVDLAQGITEKEAEFLLFNDISLARIAANRAIPGFLDLSPVRQEVLVMMAYNLGEVGLQKFRKLIAAIAISDFETAAYEMRNSLWYGQLKSRAEELARAMEKDTWEKE